MDPVSALIGGVGGLSSSLWTGGLGFLSQHISNEFSAREARRNRRWMERMSNTAHQREVEDLRKAGLNPILSATGGSGASTPSGSSPSSASPVSPVNFSEALSSAMSLYTAFKQVEKTDSEISLLDAQRDSVNSARVGQDLTNRLSEATYASSITKAESEAAFSQGKVKEGKALADKASAEARVALVRSVLDSSPYGAELYRAKSWKDAFGVRSFAEIPTTGLNYLETLFNSFVVPLVKKGSVSSSKGFNYVKNELNKFNKRFAPALRQFFDKSNKSSKKSHGGYEIYKNLRKIPGMYKY